MILRRVAGVLLMTWYFGSSFLFGQANFREAIESEDPVDRAIVTDLDERIAIHRHFLEQATLHGDSVKQLYGLLWLTYDHLNKLEFPRATEYVLKAEAIARAAKNHNWIGWVLYRKGDLHVRLKEHEQALKYYLNSADECGLAGDSLCLAECLGQASIMYAMLDDFENADRYHELAMPLIERHAPDKVVAANLSNYGAINSMNGRLDEAIFSLERAVEINRRSGRFKGEGKAMNNLADVFRRQKKFALAFETYQDCLKLNKQHQLTENLLANYRGLFRLQEEREDFRGANRYLQLYHELSDSILGAEAKEKVAKLEIQFETQQKEMELEKSKASLAHTRQKLERSLYLIAILLIIAAGIFWRWLLLKREAERERQQHERNLKDLSALLLSKNQQLALVTTKAYSGSVIHESQVEEDDFIENLYDLRILTDSDWLAFKVSFERAHPNVIQHLRSSHPSLSDGDERLCLLLRLGMNRKEMAAILGISSDSVKKSRNRLRKRLDLSEEESLEAYIKEQKVPHRYR